MPQPQNYIAFTQALSELVTLIKSLKFMDLYDNIKRQHSFRYPLQVIGKIQNSIYLDQFMHSGYLCFFVRVMERIHQKMGEKDLSRGLKLNELSSKAKKQMNIILEESIENLQESYCDIFQALPSQKSETVQFLIFLLSFFLTSVVSTVCIHLPIFKQHLLIEGKNGDYLNGLACSLINYQITGLDVTSNIYKKLKGKYYKGRIKNLDNERIEATDENKYQINVKKVQENKNAKQAIKTHRKVKTSFDLQKNLFNQTSTAGIYQHKNLNKSRVDINLQQDQSCCSSHNSIGPSAEEKELLYEIRHILSDRNNRRFIDRSEKSYIPSNRRIPSQKKTMELFQLQTNDNSNKKLTNFVTCRNSQAFKDHRINNKCLIRKKRHALSQQEIRYSSPVRKQEKHLNEEFSEKKKLYLSTSIGFLFHKKQKKVNFKDVQKHSVLNWHKKVKDIKMNNQIQRVKLAKLTKRFIAFNKEEQQKDNELLGASDAVLPSNHRFRHSTQIIHTKNNYRRGFCEFIDIRQPNQIGIVESIKTAHPVSEDYKKTKFTSKMVKDEYQKFTKNISTMQQQLDNENNYDYRIQKVISGRVRI